MGRPSFSQGLEVAACLRLGRGRRWADDSKGGGGVQKCLPLSISHTIELLALKEQLLFLSALTYRQDLSLLLIHHFSGGWSLPLVSVEQTPCRESWHFRKHKDAFNPLAGFSFILGLTSPPRDSHD